MKYLRLAVLAVLCTAASISAQTASFASNDTTLASAGGTVVFTATVNYEGEPGALGWTIELPTGWTLASVGGPNVPAIAPDVDATGTLEFAYTSVPAQRVEFTVIVRYPAGATAATATPTVLVRGGGKLTTLKPAAVEFRSAESGGQQQTRK